MGEAVPGAQGGRMREATCDVEGTAMLAQMGREGLHEDTCAAWGPPGCGE